MTPAVSTTGSSRTMFAVVTAFACIASLTDAEALETHRIGSRGDMDEDLGKAAKDKISALLMEQAAELDRLLLPPDTVNGDYLLDGVVPEESHRPLNGDSLFSLDGGRPR